MATDIARGDGNCEYYVWEHFTMYLPDPEKWEAGLERRRT